MVVLSLFDGIASGKVALERAGIHVDKYYACEVKTYAIKCAKANHPDIIHVGRIENWKDWIHTIETPDLIIGGSPCFVKGTKVITDKEYKNIEDVVVGDMVLTHKGNYKKVLRIGHQVSKTMLVDACGSLTTETTANHPYYVKTRCREWNSDTRKYDTHFSRPYWKDAGKLIKDDFVAMPIIQKEENPRSLDEQTCWILGRYIADGHIAWGEKCKESDGYRHPRVILSIGEAKLDDTKRCLEGLNFSVLKHTQSVYRVVISSKKLALMIKDIGCGEGAINKTIPMELINLPVHLLKAVLDGYMSGDGCYTGGRYKASTVSKELAMSLQLVVAKVLHVNTTIYCLERPRTTVIEGRTVNQKDTWNVEWMLETQKPRVAIIEDKCIWQPLHKIVDTGREATVYNIEVEDDNSYTANGVVVHNCQGFSSSGKQEAFDDRNSILFYTFADIVKYVQSVNPFVKFLMENVQMHNVYVGVINYILGVKAIQINSALVSAQERKRLYWCNWNVPCQPEDKHIMLYDVLDKTRNWYPLKSWMHKENQKGDVRSDRLRSVVSDKAFCITAHKTHPQNHYLSEDGTRMTYLTVPEIEKLQTLPEGYCSMLSEAEAFDVVGNGWTVDVIVHLLKYMNQ